MYRGYSLSLNNSEAFNGDYYIKEGKALHSTYKDAVKKQLEKYATEDGSLDGTAIQNDWFPSVDADVFISHSHKDENLALLFAGWLSKTFGLKAFVDSCIWGYSNELLKIIDDKYCLSEGGDAKYDYDKRNYSTSHVHLMLIAALNKMIDKCECLFFLNTSNSVSFADIKKHTLSPWIYGEIELSRTIDKKLPERLGGEMRTYSAEGSLLEKGLKDSLSINHTLNTPHLTEISQSKLTEWKNNSKFKRGITELDILYKLTI